MGKMKETQWKKFKACSLGLGLTTFVSQLKPTDACLDLVHEK
jgi:hypothetical protein